MKKIIGTFLFIVGFYCVGNAQNVGSDYTTAVGLTVYPAGVTFKTFIKPDAALEAIGYFYEDGFRVTGLYEFHYNIEGVEGLKWYAGPGAHLAVWNNHFQSEYPGNASIGIGIDGVVGLDYKIKGAPINVSLDWQPSFNFVGYNYFEGGWGGLAVRYTF